MHPSLYPPTSIVSRWQVSYKYTIDLTLTRCWTTKCVWCIEIKRKPNPNPLSQNRSLLIICGWSCIIFSVLNNIKYNRGWDIEGVKYQSTCPILYERSANYRKFTVENLAEVLTFDG